MAAFTKTSDVNDPFVRVLTIHLQGRLGYLDGWRTWQGASLEKRARMRRRFDWTGRDA